MQICNVCEIPYQFWTTILLSKYELFDITQISWLNYLKVGIQWKNKVYFYKKTVCSFYEKNCSHFTRLFNKLFRINEPQLWIGDRQYSVFCVAKHENDDRCRFFKKAFHLKHQALQVLLNFLHYYNLCHSICMKFCKMK